LFGEEIRWNSFETLFSIIGQKGSIQNGKQIEKKQRKLQGGKQGIEKAGWILKNFNFFTRFIPGPRPVRYGYGTVRTIPQMQDTNKIPK
jgi:hypothetical protein